MLPAELVIRSVKSALEQRPDAFDAIGVRHAVHEFLGAVIYSAMVIIRNVCEQAKRRQALIGRMFVSANG